MAQSASDEMLHLPMLAIYAAILGVALVYYITIAILFIRCRPLQAMRRRSMTLAMLSMVVSVIVTIVYLLVAPLRMYMTCSVSMWLSYLLLPASVVLVGSRALNLAVVRRSHEAAVLRVEESVAAQEADVKKQVMERQPANRSSQDNSQIHPWASNGPADMEEGSANAWQAKNNGAYSSTTLASPRITTGLIRSKKSAAVSRWFLRHLYMFSVKALIIYFSTFIALIAIYLLAVQFIQFDNATGIALNEWPRNDCEMRWEYHALHGFVMLLIVLGLMSFALLLIRQKLHDDAQDMRTHGQELMLSVVSWTAILSIYIALVLTAEQTKGGRDPRVFPATNLFVIGCFLDHVVSVAWPTYRAYFNLGNAGWRNINASTIAGVKSIQITGSRAQFQKLLSDPKRFREFKLFSIRNMSVENAFFYDACRSLLKSSELHDIALTEGNADPGYKDRLVRRLMWLYTTFLRASADMEVNLLGTTRRRLERAARDGVLDIPIMKKAMNEVEELMFYDTYQRYLRQHGDEVDSDVGNETTTSVTEMTNVKHKHSS